MPNKQGPMWCFTDTTQEGLWLLFLAVCLKVTSHEALGKWKGNVPLFQCHLEMEKSPVCFLFCSPVGKGQVGVAGEGQANPSGLGRRSSLEAPEPPSRGGVERQGRPWFLDSPPGPRWETREGERVAGARGACVVSPVLWCGWSGKSWQASGEGGKGQLPLIQEE